MLKEIFKNSSVLESIKNIKTLFSKNKDNKDVEISPLEQIKLEIEKLEESINKKESIDLKHSIRKKTLYLRLKEFTLITSNSYLKRAYEILENEVDDALYDALEYLQRLPKNLDKDTQNEIFIFKALIFEALEEFDSATAEYKKALALNTTPTVLKRYKEFIQRTREVLNWHKSPSNDIGFSSFNIHNITKLEDMPKVAQNLDKIAKYYARSPKSRSLGKRYHKEVMKLYQILAKEYPKDYTCAYINSLIEAVELFMFPPTLLKEAQDLLYKNYDCIKSRVQLSAKLKDLKQKIYIKKAILE